MREKNSSHWNDYNISEAPKQPMRIHTVKKGESFEAPQGSQVFIQSFGGQINFYGHQGPAKSTDAPIPPTPAPGTNTATEKPIKQNTGSAVKN